MTISVGPHITGLRRERGSGDVQRAGSRDGDSPGRQKAKLGAALKPQAPRVGVGSQGVRTAPVRADQASVETPPSGRGPACVERGSSLFQSLAEAGGTKAGSHPILLSRGPGRRREQDMTADTESTPNERTDTSQTSQQGIPFSL